MNFREKIDLILQAKKMSLYKLARVAGVSALEKAYRSGREMGQTSTWKLLAALNVRDDWWNHGTGEMFNTAQSNGQVLRQPVGALPLLDISKETEIIQIPRRAFDQLEAGLIQSGQIINQLAATNAELNRMYLELIRLFNRKPAPPAPADQSAPDKAPIKKGKRR